MSINANKCRSTSDAVRSNILDLVIQLLLPFKLLTDHSTVCVASVRRSSAWNVGNNKENNPSKNNSKN